MFRNNWLTNLILGWKMKVEVENALKKLKELYDICPPVECFQSGECCVSPHLSFMELVYLLDYLLDNFDKSQLQSLAARQPQLSTKFEGNLVCPLQSENLCSAHPGRGLSCRLEGHHVFDRYCERNHPICVNAQKKTGLETAELKDYENFAIRLVEINRAVYPILSPPYYLDGLTLECWFAVCFDTGITQSLFTRLRRIIRERFGFDFLQEEYTGRTGMSEKIRLIGEFTLANQNGNDAEALQLITKIRNDFPFTGTFYYWQAEHYYSLLAQK